VPTTDEETAVPHGPAGSWQGDDGLLGHVMRATLVVNRVLDDICGRQGTTPSDYLVLAVVRRSPGHRTSPTTVCEVLGRTTGGMSLTVDRLEAAGLLRRLPDPTDRRRIVLEATAEGVRLALAVNEALRDWEAALPLTVAQRLDVADHLDQLAGAARNHLDGDRGRA
jgi:DNA-binding MarR family transcriptional regulator